jgi:MFS family permease
MLFMLILVLLFVGLPTAMAGAGVLLLVVGLLPELSSRHRRVVYAAAWLGGAVLGAMALAGLLCAFDESPTALDVMITWLISLAAGAILAAAPVGGIALIVLLTRKIRRSRASAAA